MTLPELAIRRHVTTLMIIVSLVVLGGVALALGCTPAQAALAWTLRNPAVTSPIIGARTCDQLEDNLGALAVELESEQWARLDDISRVATCFPHDMIGTPKADLMFGSVTVGPRTRR